MKTDLILKLKQNLFSKVGQVPLSKLLEENKFVVDEIAQMRQG